MFDGVTSRCTTPISCRPGGQRVRVVKAGRHLLRDVRPRSTEPSAPWRAEHAHHGRQVLAVQVLHGQEVRAADLAEVVDLHDVRVVQQRRQPRLVAEHPDQLGRVRLLGADALDDEDAAEALHPLRHRPEDLRHPAAPDALDQVVATVSFVMSWRRLGVHQALSAGLGGFSTLPNVDTTARLRDDPACSSDGARLSFRYGPQGPGASGRLLLGQAVQRPEPPHQIDRVDADHRAVGEQLGQDAQRPAVVRVVERRHQHHARWRCRSSRSWPAAAAPSKTHRRRHRQADHAQRRPVDGRSCPAAARGSPAAGSRSCRRRDRSPRR